MSGRPSSNKGSSVGAAAEAPARSPSGGAGGKRGSALQARAAPPATPQDQPEQQAKRKRELSPPLHVAPSPDTPAAQLVREIHRVARLAAALGFAEARPLILSAIGAYAELGALKVNHVEDDRYAAAAPEAAEDGPQQEAEQHEAEQQQQASPAKRARKA